MDRSNILMFFDEPTHKYTDSLSGKYTSVTTVLGYYENKFDKKKYDIATACAKIGQNPGHDSYKKYAGMTVEQILAKWDKAREDGCEIGNVKHNYLDNSIKLANGYRSITGSTFINKRIYTINDIMQNPIYGQVDLKYFESLGVKEQYPRIYEVISNFVELGYRVYSEICVFDPVNRIAGLIDVLLIKGNQFLIIDWKTNKARLMFKSGYFKKDIEDNLTDEFIENDEKFIFPLHKYPQSVGHKYTFQLSLYDYLAEGFGLECIGNLLFHIRHNNYESTHEDVIANPEWIDRQQVDIYPIQYLKNDMAQLVSDFSRKEASGYIDGKNIASTFKLKSNVAV